MSQQGSYDPALLTVAAVGIRGVAVYPGQSGEDVLKVAGIIERELDAGHYVARAVARQILLALRVDGVD